mmetsp:Transcript_4770/g.8478  ORF Transcript_4770/g.8478 Transcript_4770/m.8478 type:complete len:545 (+) Transcript_4770:241-1875(+)
MAQEGSGPATGAQENGGDGRPSMVLQLYVVIDPQDGNATAETVNGGNLDGLLRHVFRSLGPTGASKEALERLAVKKAKGREDGSCPVCLSDYEPEAQIMELPCKHQFCKECVTKWLETKNSCPLCRSAVDTSSRTQEGGPDMQGFMQVFEQLRQRAQAAAQEGAQEEAGVGASAGEEPRAQGGSQFQVRARAHQRFIQAALSTLEHARAQRARSQAGGSQTTEQAGRPTVSNTPSISSSFSIEPSFIDMTGSDETPNWQSLPGTSGFPFLETIRQSFARSRRRQTRQGTSNNTNQPQNPESQTTAPSGQPAQAATATTTTEVPASATTTQSSTINTRSATARSSRSARATIAQAARQIFHLGRPTSATNLLRRTPRDTRDNNDPNSAAQAAPNSTHSAGPENRPRQTSLPSRKRRAEQQEQASRKSSKMSKNVARVFCPAANESRKRKRELAASKQTEIPGGASKASSSSSSSSSPTTSQSMSSSSSVAQPPKKEQKLSVDSNQVDWSKCSVRALKRMLRSRKIDFSRCLEKSDLVKLLDQSDG